MTHHRTPQAELDETIAEDVRAVFDEPRSPTGFSDRLHDAVDAGFLDPSPRRRLWPIAVTAAVAAGIALALAPRLWRTEPSPADLQMRSTDGIPLAVEMSVLAVSDEGAVTEWVHAGDEVAADAWLRFRLQAPPGVHLSLIHVTGTGALDIVYQWPVEGDDVSRVSRDGDVWYPLADLRGEQTFVCITSDQPLDERLLARAMEGEAAGEARVRVDRLPLRVIR